MLIWIDHMNALLQGKYQEFLRSKLRDVMPQTHDHNSSNLLVQSPEVNEMTRVNLQGE